MKLKIIYMLDVIVIIISLILIMFFVGYVQPLVISPIQNFETNENMVLFSIQKAERVLIDRNREFTNPREFLAKDGLKIELEPGEYYWRAINSLGIESEVNKLTVISKIDLRLKEVFGGYEVVNAGNVLLNVDVYDEVEKIDSFKLVSDELRKSNGTKFFGWWNDE
jgi:hypothetical protein